MTIVATDTTGAESGSIIVDITVMDRNDGPVVDVGGGDSMDFVTTFVENGPSIPIGTVIHSSFKFTDCGVVFAFSEACVHKVIARSVVKPKCFHASS